LEKGRTRLDLSKKNRERKHYGAGQVKKQSCSRKRDVFLEKECSSNGDALRGDGIGKLTREGLGKRHKVVEVGL